MAVNLVNSNDIEVTQTGDNIQLNTSTPITTIDENIGQLSSLATTDKSSLVNAINELKNAEVYSTDEVKTNEVWKVGGVNKPVYMLEIDYTIIAGTNAWHNVATINNVDIIKIIDLSVKRESQQYLNIWNGYNFYFENNTLKEQHTSSYYEGYHLYITVKYIKTTD